MSSIIQAFDKKKRSYDDNDNNDNNKIQDLIQEIRRIKCNKYISYFTSNCCEPIAIPANTDIERAIKEDGRFNIIGYHTVDIKIYTFVDGDGDIMSPWQFDEELDIKWNDQQSELVSIIKDSISDDDD